MFKRVEAFGAATSSEADEKQREQKNANDLMGGRGVVSSSIGKTVIGDSRREQITNRKEVYWR